MSVEKCLVIQINQELNTVSSPTVLYVLQFLIKLESFYLKDDAKRNAKRKYRQESEMLLNVILDDIHEQQKEANKKIIEAKNACLRHFVNACGIEHDDKAS